MKKFDFYTFSFTSPFYFIRNSPIRDEAGSSTISLCLLALPIVFRPTLLYRLYDSYWYFQKFCKIRGAGPSSNDRHRKRYYFEFSSIGMQKYVSFSSNLHSNLHIHLGVTLLFKRCKPSILKWW